MGQTRRQFMYKGDLYQHNTSLSGTETYLRNGYVINAAAYLEFLDRYFNELQRTRNEQYK